MRAYPQNEYPELMQKQGRPYACLLISTEEYYICIPFRSSIRHSNAYLFTTTERARRSQSGLDYSKIVLIKNFDYIDTKTMAIVDQDEYVELMNNIQRIVEGALEYIDQYTKYRQGIIHLHHRQYERKYGKSTLPYFEDILGLK